MKLYEYQGKTIFSKYGIRVPKGLVIQDSKKISNKLLDISFPVMVKAQILSGGRGKAGGIISSTDSIQLSETVKNMLDSELKDSKIDAVLVEEKVNFTEEFYLSITLDSLTRMPMIIFSVSGGIDIEDVAAKTPEKIIKLLIDPLIGIQEFHFEKLLRLSGITKSIIKDQLKDTVTKLYKIYDEYDAMVVEINPLMRLTDDTLIAADAKVEIDDSAIFRHEDILKWKNERKVDPLMKMASDLRFLLIDVNTEGNVGVISNGSGMIMSCVDWIAKSGGQVVSALDLGGGATSERVAEGIKIMLQSKKVKSLLISIFGGITRCDEIATGILKAVSELSVTIPIVAKLDGTNKEKGMELLIDAQNEKIQIANGLKEASMKVMLAQKE